MTTYATPEMVRAALAVPDSAPPDTVRIPIADITDDAITPHIVQSDSIATTYCSGKPVPDAFIATQSTNIAAYLLVLAWRGSADFVSQTDPVWLRYQMSMTMLEDVAKGLISPVVEPDPADGGVTVAGPDGDVRLTTINSFGHGVRVDQPFGYPDNTYPYGYGGYGW